MTEPLDQDVFDVLDDVPGAKKLVRDMLAAVVDQSDVYANSFTLHNSGNGSFTYFLGKRGGKEGTFINDQSLSANIANAPVSVGVIQSTREPNQQKHCLGFTDAAIEWHKQYGGPSVDHIRKVIGRELYRHLEVGFPQDFDEHEVAKKLGVPSARVVAQVHVLLAAKLIEPKYSGMTNFGSMSLTRPDGVRWAAGDYPSIAQIGGPSVSVAVSLHFEIKNILEQTRAIDIDSDLRDRFEARLRRVEEELEKPAGEGKFETVKDLVSTANDSKDLFGAIVPFLFTHWDKIQGFASAAGNILPH